MVCPGRTSVAAVSLLVFKLTSWLSSVVQTLAHNSTATLSVIKDYLVNKLQKQSCQIKQDEQRILKYREETTRIRQEIEELKARCRTVVSCLQQSCCSTSVIKNSLCFSFVLYFCFSFCFLSLSVPRSFRRPSVVSVPVPWSFLQSTSCVVIPSTSTALRATRTVTQNVLLACLKTAK